MNCSIKTVSSATAALFVLLGSQSAFALTTEHATICKPYGNSGTAGLFSYTNGVYNNSGTAMGVICPVVRTVAAGAAGYSVWVDGTSSSTTSCTLYSYNYAGAYLGSTSFSATGRFSRLLTLPQSQVPTYSSQAVYCYLPTNGSLNDIEPVQ